MNKRLCVLLLLLCCMHVNAQKHFAAQVTLPRWAKQEDITIWLYNGKHNLPLKDIETDNNQLDISGEYFGRYAVLGFAYKYANAGKTTLDLFVSETTASIDFSANDSVQQTPFKHYTLVNALDFKTAHDTLFTLQEDAVINYVKQHAKSYYSFWYFRSHVCASSLIGADSLLHLYNSIFSDSLRKSEEGDAVAKMLKGKLYQHQDYVAPLFTAKDIKGNTVDLKSYRNKKPVLLVFWAAWCEPCLRELPAIKDISSMYFPGKLEIISVAFPSNYSTYLQIIRAQNLSWTHVYNNRIVINAYGGFKRIPRIYLVDKAGTVVYESHLEIDEDDELLKLKEKLSSLFN